MNLICQEREIIILTTYTPPQGIFKSKDEKN